MCYINVNIFFYDFFQHTAWLKIFQSDCNICEIGVKITPLDSANLQTMNNVQSSMETSFEIFKLTIFGLYCIYSCPLFCSKHHTQRNYQTTPTVYSNLKLMILYFYYLLCPLPGIYQISMSRWKPCCKPKLHPFQATSRQFTFRILPSCMLKYWPVKRRYVFWPVASKLSLATRLVSWKVSVKPW